MVGDKIEYCGKLLPLPSESGEWLWVTIEMKIPDGETDKYTPAGAYKCGTLTDNGILVLLCPSCLQFNGRKW